MKLHTLDDGSPLLEFRAHELGDFTALVERLRRDFGFGCQGDPQYAGRCCLELDGMHLEAGPSASGYSIRPLDLASGDLLRVVVGAVLKEADDRTRQSLRQAARAMV